MTKILVCDDDSDMIEFCSRLFAMKGYEILVAHNAADAISTTVAATPDLLILDMNMPVSAGGDVGQFAGLEAARKIRASSSVSAGVPIIALTGNVMADQRDRILEAGCNQLLEKPIVDFNHFLDTIAAHLPR